MALRQVGFRGRHGTADLSGRLVFAQHFIDDLSEQVLIRPGQIFEFGKQ
jgi:hypothetical protein